MVYTSEHSGGRGQKIASEGQFKLDGEIVRKEEKKREREKIESTKSSLGKQTIQIIHRNIHFNG